MVQLGKTLKAAYAILRKKSPDLILAFFWSLFLILPFKFLSGVLGIMYINPLITGFFACLFLIVVSCYNNKDLPTKLTLTQVFTSAFVIANTIYLCSDTINSIFTVIYVSHLWVLPLEDYLSLSVKTIRDLTLYMDNTAGTSRGPSSDPGLEGTSTRTVASRQELFDKEGVSRRKQPLSNTETAKTSLGLDIDFWNNKLKKAESDLGDINRVVGQNYLSLVKCSQIDRKTEHVEILVVFTENAPHKDRSYITEYLTRRDAHLQDLMKGCESTQSECLRKSRYITIAEPINPMMKDAFDSSNRKHVSLLQRYKDAFFM